MSIPHKKKKKKNYYYYRYRGVSIHTTNAIY